LSLSFETMEFAKDCDFTQDTCAVYLPLAENSPENEDADDFFCDASVENVCCLAVFFAPAFPCFFADESSE